MHQLIIADHVVLFTFHPRKIKFGGIPQQQRFKFTYGHGLVIIIALGIVTADIQKKINLFLCLYSFRDHTEVKPLRHTDH